MLLLVVPIAANSQSRSTDSLKHDLKFIKTDSARFFLLTKIMERYRESNRDSAITYLDKMALLAKKNNKTLDEAGAYNTKGYELLHLGRSPEALQCLQLAIKLEENPENDNKTWNPHKIKKGYSTRLNYLGYGNLALAQLMWSVGNDSLQIVLNKKAIKLATVTDDKILLSLTNMNLGKAYGRLNRLDSALIYEKKASYFASQTNYKLYIGSISRYTAVVYEKKSDYRLALQYYCKALADALPQNNIFEASVDYNGISQCYLKLKNADSALYYSKKDLEAVKALKSRDLDEPYECLYKSYELKHEIDSAYKYQGLLLAVKVKLSTTNAASAVNFQKLFLKEQQRAQLLDKEKEIFKARATTYVLLATAGIFVLLAGVFHRNNRHKQKANKLLQQQKDEVQQALSKLKAAQTQLIQSEKMASLGELTAGIAHEIQNPLNFVNNFSEVNREMIDELKEELKDGNIDEAIAIANGIQQNEEKINHHGKRADAIVKGMLGHSRASTGQKEPTDINALADEYLRLAYHGLRAKDKAFNAELITNYTDGLPKVNIVPQDMGRVLLNLFNNAFYAVKEKQKTAGKDYKPTVEVSTFSPPSGGWGVSVRDNGNGIPDAIKDKIMQPFFTTKPTGEGTGLGLSLSYDIIVKGHGGKIDVKSDVGSATEFTLLLPLQA
jgi:signal transduction histidine kinase